MAKSNPFLERMKTHPYVGKYDLKMVGVKVPNAIDPTVIEDKEDFVVTAKYDLGKNVTLNEFSERQVPEGLYSYVPFGHFESVKAIVTSGAFMPTMITGLSGNGKTQMIKEICARLHREYIRANITSDTDEDDLIGGFRLINGETVFSLGPVPVAMMRGAILLLDEIDLGTSKIMCLQAVLEGQPLYIKKIGKYVYPAPGFQIFATGNTKGQGDLTGKFSHTQIMNEAMLERFVVTMEQDYPPDQIEHKILAFEMKHANIKHTNDLIPRLVKWANQIRKSYDDNAIQDLLTTRRIVNIVRMLPVFSYDETTAVKYGISRFDTATQKAMLAIWDKMKPVTSKSASSPTSPRPEVDIDLTGKGGAPLK